MAWKEEEEEETEAEEEEETEGGEGERQGQSRTESHAVAYEDASTITLGQCDGHGIGSSWHDPRVQYETCHSNKRMAGYLRGQYRA
eukprot:466584-Rhodomonas_salina.1